MSRIKVMLAALVAVMAIGVVGASAASADVGSGEAEVTVGGIGCDVTFDWDSGTGGGTPPATGQTIGLENMESDGACLVQVNDGGGDLFLTGDGTQGQDAVLEGFVDVEIISIFPPAINECSFEGELEGGWNPSVSVTGEVELVDGDGGCPETAEPTIEVTDWTS